MVDTRVLAIDIGGTKIAVASGAADGLLRGRQQAPTPKTQSAELIFEAIAKLIDASLAQSADHLDEMAIIAVGCGGPMEMGGRNVSPLNIPAWRNFPLLQRLSDCYGRPVVIDNDAKALALGEGWMGAAQHCRNYLAMVVSTGIGAGIVLDGRLLDGEHGNAGHLGHVIVKPGGRPCVCGVQGCLEAEASGTAIEHITGASPKDASEAVKVQTGYLVGQALASAVSLLDLDLVCVAGSVALGYGDLFFEAANRSLAEHSGLSYTKTARIVPAGLGDAGPLLGAVALGLRELGELPL